MENAGNVGFSTYVVVLVPLYVVSTLVGLKCLKSWLEGQISFLGAAFYGGAFGYIVHPVVRRIQLQAFNELGMSGSWVLFGANLVLWAVGIVVFFWCRSKIGDLVSRRRYKMKVIVVD